MPGRHVLPAWRQVLALTLALWAIATAFAASARADTTVSLTFDDGQASQVQVKDMLASHAMKGTFFVNSAKVGTSSFYMTWPQVEAIAAGGNEIGGHTLTHVDLTDTAISETERRRQVCEDRQNLIARGYDPIDFAYPNGWGDALAESIVRDCGYTTGRRVGGIVSPNWCPSCGSPRAESIPPEDPYLVRTPAFGSGEITLSALQNVIMQAEFGGGWVPIVFHGVCTTACDEGWVKPTTLSAFMDWLQPRSAQGTVVRTMREALKPTPPPAALETTIDSKPPGTTIDKNASFTLSSNQVGATFECSLDNAGFAACPSSVSYSGLSVGQHTFRARARDASGTVDQTPASWTWTINPPPAPTTVSLTFDDGQATQYDVRQVLKDHGMRGTFFINSGSVCTSDCAGAFDMTWQQIADLAADGNEIGGHTIDHVDLTSAAISATEKRRQVCEDRQNLIARGFDPVSFAYPYSHQDAAAKTIVSDCGYTSARSAGDAPAGGETIPPLDRFATRTADFSTGEITLAEMQSVITQAENVGGGWVQLTFHGICATACNEGWVKPSTFAALLDWLQPRATSTGTVVRTVRQVMGVPVDGTSPDTSITDGPSGTVASANASFSFSSTEAGTFECKLDAGAWTGCSSPKPYSGLANGSHTFSVRAKDAAGNVDATPASRTWTADVPPPDTSPARTVVSLTFDDGESSQVQVKDMLASHGMKGTFFVNSAKVGTSSFYMTWAQVDTLAADGNEIAGHTLSHVDLMDTSVSETERRRQVCEDRQNLIARGYDPVDFAYPNGWGDALAESMVRDCGYTNARRIGGIVSPNWCPTCGDPRAETLPPEDPYLVRTPAFGSGEITLGALQNVITQAELGGGWVPLVFHGVCTTACGEGWVRPTTLTALMDWLQPRAAGTGTVVRTMRAALNPNVPPPAPAPDTSITGGPSGTVSSGAASFDFSSDKASATFECKLDSGAWDVCASPKPYSGLADGSHTFSVRAKDGGTVDPSPATRTWSVDTAAPDTAITSGPTGTVGATTASFGFSATETGSSFECKLDAGDWETCTSPRAYSSVGAGSHTFSVRAKDGAGNQDGTPASRTWTVDTSAPDTSITSGPSGTVNTASASFAFSATKAGSTFECQLDAGAWAACTSPKAYSSLANGSHTFSVRAKDASGNLDATPATRTWTIDRTAPNTSITSGPSGTVSATTATFAFTSTEAGSTFECRLDGGAWAACTSPKTYTGVARGSHTFSVRAKDAAGNVDASPASRSWKRR